MLELKDWFAAEAMKALILKEKGSVHVSALAAEAYNIADWMYEERLKHQPPPPPTAHPKDEQGLYFPNNEEIALWANNKILAIKAMRARLMGAGLPYELKLCKDSCEKYGPLGKVAELALQQNPYFG